MKPEARVAMFERLRARNPHPTTELEYDSPFELLIAVILSAQATDKSVNIATRQLFPVANTPQAIHALSLEGLLPFVRTIGLARATLKIGMANIVYNIHRLLYLKRAVAT